MSSVDVVVPCYRYGRYLRECVESILAQSEADVRVLIIDDASPDDAAEVGTQLASEDSKVTFLRHSRNKGHIATYNEGIEWASSEYFLLLSADDFLLPGALGRATRLMEKHSNVGFTFGSVVELSDEGVTKEVEPVARFPDGENQIVMGGLEFIDISGARNIVPTPTAVVRTRLQKAVGGYKPELPHAGDMEMWFRLAAHASVGVIRESQAVYRRHANNMSHAYYADRWLRDLQQRKTAIDSFFASCGRALPEAQSLRGKLLHSLGREALGWASAAFNDGELGLCNELSVFAVDSSSSVRGTLAWARLRLKRRVGVSGWRTIQRLISMFQQPAVTRKGQAR